MPIKDLRTRISGILNESLLEPPAEATKKLTLQFWQIFLESLPETLGLIHNSEGDRVQLRKSAHKLKGACGFAGATRLRKLAAILEEMAESVTKNELEYFCGIISQVAEETAVRMQNEIASTQSG